MYVNRCGVVFVLFLTLSLGFSKGFSDVRSIQLQRRPTRPAQLQDFEIRFCCTAAGVQDCFAEQWQRDFRCLPTFLASRNTTARPSKLRENFCRAMTGHSERLTCNTGALHQPASGRPRTNFLFPRYFQPPLTQAAWVNYWCLIGAIDPVSSSNYSVCRTCPI